MLREWSVAKLNKENAIDISHTYGVPMLIGMLLDIRGITNEKDILDFLNNEVYFDDVSNIKDIDKAVKRIKEAIESEELICVYGDFDADGVTSTALLYSYLSDIGSNVMFYIPSREEEGYGMNEDAIDKLKEQGVSLIITVDNGIAAVDEVAYANSLGIDVVITDHHIPPEVLPNAYAIVDLHQSDCNSKFKDLSGVGVAFKLVMAIEGEYADVQGLLENYSDIAAIGTIGDIVPLLGENRVLVKQGLMHINNRERIGINALIDSAGFQDKDINSGCVSFSLVPRINACGRLGLSNSSVNMLLTDDVREANEIALELNSDNTSRQQIEKDILEDINEMIKANPSLVQNKVIVIVGENWHQGVIGIVASRIKDAYGKPAIVITSDGENYRGSGRSVNGFSLIDALFLSSEYLDQFGGHPMAVGFAIKRENIDKFINHLNTIPVSDSIPLPTLNLDCKLNPSQLSINLVSPLYMMEPFGAGNPKPLFGLYNMTIRDIVELSGGKHLKLVLSRDATNVVALKFNTTLLEFPYVVGDVIDLAVSLDVNEYNGNEQLSIIVRDTKFSDYDMVSQLMSKAVFERFCIGDKISKEDAKSIIPNREEFASVYRFLRTNKGFDKAIDVLNYRVDKNMAYGKLRVILESLSELGLVQIYEGMKDTRIVMCEVTEKKSLSDSIIIKKLEEVSLNG